MKRGNRVWIGLVGTTLLGAAGALASCSSEDKPADSSPADAGSDAEVPKPGPGEQCFEPQPNVVRVRFEAAQVVLAPGQTREVGVVVDPDFCEPETVTFGVEDESVVPAPEAGRIDLVTPRLVVSLTGGQVGSTTLTASVPKGDGTDATASIPVEVMSPEIAACSGGGSGRVDDGTTISGSDGLQLASVGLQQGATAPNQGSYIWSADPFDVTIACAPDQVPDGYLAIGPAVSFAPEDLTFRREIPFSLPVNLAALPEKARLRHVTVSYTGPRAATPRAVPIADPYISRDASGQYSLSFMAPWLGSYQAIVKADAGTAVRNRRLTYRAVVGVSMGGGGTAMHGLRNHERFDVLAPLGGPVEWTWLMGHIEKNHMGGFLPNDGTNVPTELAPMPEPSLPYEHPSTFNRWWYEYPKNGNGGSFPRAEYVQIFRDLALMFGNPNSYNAAPNAENLPAGVPPDDPTVVGDHPGRECAVWVDPIGGHPDEDAQRELDRNCPAERCSYTLTLDNYYDREFNPLGTFPVITVCDGSPQDSSLSPYANTWKPEGNDKPLELALAVDYNGNGQRDENEPIISQGHEPYEDTGTDGVASVDEPGYAAGTNEDPNGDDWHAQYNPTGTENNYRWDDGEPYDDFGLDGVDATASSPYDFGEGNGQFDYAPGYRTFIERDARSVMERHPWATHPQPLDDDALARLDLWSDGGTRDLFNFAVDAQALMGGWAGRGRIVHYYTRFSRIPGQERGDERSFTAGNIIWQDVPGGVMLRYGKIDPNETDINTGSGQHVGTADEIARRLQTALYYIGSRWQNAPRTLDETSALNPDPQYDLCFVNGGCDFEFTDSKGRSGPVSVNLPPGYANASSQDKRYPVIYLLHGYGQTPEDLKAAIVFLQNWMNSPADSSVTRLPKAIMVYVDGRCRPNADADEAECIRGTFFTDSVRENGPKMEAWWNELDDWVTENFRTMEPETVDWVE